MKLSTPDDEDEDVEDAQDSDEITPTDPVETGAAIDEDLVAQVEQLRDEIEAVRRSQDGLRERISLLEQASDRRDRAIGELQAGFEMLANQHDLEAAFEYDRRDL